MVAKSRALQLEEKKTQLFLEVVTNLKTLVDALLDEMATQTFTSGFELREPQIILLDAEHWSEEVKKMLKARLEKDGWDIFEREEEHIVIWKLSAKL